LPTQEGQPIVAPPIVIQFWLWAVSGLDNQSISQEALDRAIERTWAKLDSAMRAFSHFLHDGVSMPIGISQGQKDLKRCWVEWEEPEKVGLNVHRSREIDKSILHRSL
jgi:hypothetical protein